MHEWIDTTDGRFLMDTRNNLMIKHIRIELLVGLVTLLWAIMSVAFRQPVMVDHLNGIMPGSYWSFSGLLIGSAQIYISRNPPLLNTFTHWCVAFISAIFWGYLGSAAVAANAGLVPILIFWSTMAATLWELAHVRS